MRHSGSSNNFQLSTTNGSVYFYEKVDLSLTLSASNVVYDGNPHGAELTNDSVVPSGWSNIGNNIEYYKYGSTSKLPGGAPSAAGKYTAKLTVAGIEATMDFEITPAEVYLVANDVTAAYSGGEQTVQSTYYAIDPDSGAAITPALTFADTVKAVGTGTNAGTYDVTFSGVDVGVTRDEGNNYIVTKTIPSKLTITSGTPGGSVKMNNFTVGGADYVAPALEGKAGDGEVTFKYYKVSDDTSVNDWSVNVAYTLGADTYMMYAVIAESSDGNYKAGQTAATSFEVLKQAYPKPTASFVADGNDSGKLTGLEPNAAYEYTFTGTASTSFTADAKGEYALASGAVAGTLNLVRKGDETYGDSPAQEITVWQEAQPTGLSGAPCTDAGNDGKITGVEAGKAYQIKTTNGDYTDATNDNGELTGLAKGEYYVRAAAHDAYLASDDSAAVTIAQGVTVNYLAYEGGQFVEKSTNALPINENTTTWSGWLVAQAGDNPIEISNRVTVSGNVNLILADGATLTASKGITVTGDNSLTIYAQSYDIGADYSAATGTGKLIATGASGVSNGGDAGIGGTRTTAGGTVTIHGGTVTATGGTDNNNTSNGGAGIGGGSGAKGGTVTIYGGTVTANGGYRGDGEWNCFGGAGIGGGSSSGDTDVSGGTVNIYGGIVNATGYAGGAGIGGGNSGNGYHENYGKGAEVVIYGGEVTATGHGGAAGIGGGAHNGTGGTVKIYDGTVTANGSDCTAHSAYGAGIGGGSGGTNGNQNNGAGGVVEIYGGIVNAFGGTGAMGIGKSGFNSATNGTLTLGTLIRAYSHTTQDMTAAETKDGPGSFADLGGTFRRYMWTRPVQPTPNVTFTAQGYDYGVLSDVGDGLKYKKTGDNDYQNIPADGLLTGLDENDVISVIKPGDGTTTFDSAPQEITVLRAAAPAENAITASAYTTAADADGAISVKGSGSYEYRIGSDAQYADLPVTGLAPGSYSVRAKASGVYLASADTAPIIIKEKLPTPTLTEVKFQAKGVDNGELKGEAGMAYYLNDDTAAVWDITGANPIALSGLKKDDKIHIYRVADDAVYKIDSAILTINVGQPAAPAAYAIESDANANNGKIVVTVEPKKDYEYRSVNANNYSNVPSDGVVSNLASGGYVVRVAASDSDLASPDYEVIVKEKEATPTPVFEAQDDVSGRLTGSSGQAYYLNDDTANVWTITDTNPITVSGLKKGSTINVYAIGSDVYRADSDVYVITLDAAAQPNLKPVQPKVGQIKGTIPTVAGIHQIYAGQTWRDAADNEQVDKDTYQVRVKATGWTLASPAQEIKIATAYYVTVQGGTGSDYYIAGDAVTVTATVPSGKVFDKWTSDYITAFDTATSETAKFTMIGQDVTVTATFKDAPAPYVPSGGGTTTTYKITVEEAANGTVTASEKTAAAGTTVKLTVTPGEGYELDTIKVTAAKGGDVAVKDNAFTMPADDVTVKAAFKEKEKEKETDPCDAFTDLDTAAWYHDGVHYALEKGYMQGEGNGIFNPNGTTTRAVAAQLLWNMAGKPVVNAAIPFADVKTTDWFAQAVSWAADQGIVNGWTDETAGELVFHPDDIVTREQFAAMLYRYAKLNGLGFTGLWSFQLDFPDVADLSDWAVEPMSWMVMNGIIKGMDGKLNPKGSSTRAQIATMIQRYDAIEK